MDSKTIHTCDCGFQWEHGKSGSHQCGPYYRARIAKLETAIASLQSPAVQEPTFIGRVFVDQLTGKRSAVLNRAADELPDMARIYASPLPQAAQHTGREQIRNEALEEAALVCDEMGEHWAAYKDTALLNGDVALSNAASGEPRAAEFLAKAIRNLITKSCSCGVNGACSKCYKGPVIDIQSQPSSTDGRDAELPSVVKRCDHNFVVGDNHPFLHEGHCHHCYIHKDAIAQKENGRG